MKKIITIIALAVGSTSVFAQQDPQFSQFMFNKLFMNPAYAGMKNAFCFTAIGRQQWSGFDGSPRSGVFSADLATPDYHGGFGLNVMYDKLGFENNARYDLDYSYHIDDVAHGKLGIGIELGAFSKRVGPTGNDQWNATTNWTADPSIPTQLKKTVGDLGLGLWYQRKSLWFGISSSHLNSKLIDDGQDGFLHNMKYQMARHYFITGGVTVFHTNDWDINPSFLVKTDATITTMDLNVMAMFRQRFWFSASYRYKDAVCPMIGFQASGMKVGFAYDYTTSNLKNYNNGTFELFLNYCLPIGDPKTTKDWDLRLGNW